MPSIDSITDAITYARLHISESVKDRTEREKVNAMLKQAKDDAEQLANEINWLHTNGNRAVNVIRGLLATETVEQEKWLKDSLEAAIVLIQAEHPQEASK